ncbi:MAG: hypothetical protein KQA31_03660 [Candidatus Aenigmarchaeota archaeon]|nr:hypothetical protein [Candidatus Aenigmarchaeota archaeon]
MRFLYIILILMILLSGCIEQSNISDNILIDIDYEKNVISGFDLPIKVYITNNFKKDIKNVKIYFDNLGILNFKNIEECRGSKIDKGCVFQNIYSGEAEKVVFLVNIPESSYISGSKIKAQISISYDSEDQKVISIPILGNEYKEIKTLSEYSTGGPVNVNVKISSNDNAKSFVRSGDIIFLEVDISSNSENVVIKKDDFSISLIGFSVYGDNKNCDFEGYNVLKPKNDIYLPLDSHLTCIIKAKNLNDETSWFDGKIIVDYYYNFKITKNVIINI